MGVAEKRCRYIPRQNSAHVGDFRGPWWNCLRSCKSGAATWMPETADRTATAHIGPLLATHGIGESKCFIFIFKLHIDPNQPWNAFTQCVSKMECESEWRQEGSVVFQTRLPFNHEGSHTWDSRCKNTISYDHASPQQNLQWYIYILLISRQKHLQWQIKIHQGLNAMQITLLKTARKFPQKRCNIYHYKKPCSKLLVFLKQFLHPHPSSSLRRHLHFVCWQLLVGLLLVRQQAELCMPT